MPQASACRPKRMSRPRLRPAFAACSCSWKPSLTVAASSQHAYATLSASAATPTEPPLDFLYPAFGFFSRSLPSSRATPPPLPRNPPILPARVERSPPAFGPAAGSRRRGFEPAGKCVCGRPKQSCLRCRSVSTSAAPSRIQDELLEVTEEEEVPPNLRDSVQDELATIPPAPPPPLASPASPIRADTREVPSSPEADSDDRPLLEPLCESQKPDCFDSRR